MQTRTAGADGEQALIGKAGGEDAMAVYVHKLEGQSKAFFGRTAAPDPWFILAADTDNELHAFAASLGLTRVMFRPGKEALPNQEPVAGHYVITMGERDRAVALGATLISRREADRMLRQRATGMGYG
ncbi:MAG TPA: DUF4031 domain-containing protein [Streptosporangiaceae bacterium]|nr:DUF4031 domain-containing protein [Streptosporangiaceae bacterium]